MVSWICEAPMLNFAMLVCLFIESDLKDNKLKELTEDVYSSYHFYSKKKTSHIAIK